MLLPATPLTAMAATGNCDPNSLVNGGGATKAELVNKLQHGDGCHSAAALMKKWV